MRKIIIYIILLCIFLLCSCKAHKSISEHKATEMHGIENLNIHSNSTEQSFDSLFEQIDITEIIVETTYDTEKSNNPIKTTTNKKRKIVGKKNKVSGIVTLDTISVSKNDTIDITNDEQTDKDINTDEAVSGVLDRIFKVVISLAFLALIVVVCKYFNHR